MAFGFDLCDLIGVSFVTVKFSISLHLAWATLSNHRHPKVSTKIDRSEGEVSQSSLVTGDWEKLIGVTAKARSTSLASLPKASSSNTSTTNKHQQAQPSF
jgi:hypothetical protein